MKTRVLGVFVAAVWCAALVYGIHTAMLYDTTPGKEGAPQPVREGVSGKQWTCVLAAHPQCPCTRATFKAMREVVTLHPALRVEVVFVGDKPAEASENMELAARIPGAQI